MFTVISAVTNDDVAREYLLRGLKRQTAKHELLLIHNKTGAFSSAAQPYNCTSRKAAGDYLMFIHQDVYLPSPTWLKDAQDTLSTLSNLGIAGPAGLTKPRGVNSFELIARYYLVRRLRLFPVWFRRYGKGMVLQGAGGQPWFGAAAKEAVSVQTLDELLLVVPAEVFARTKFDESVCDGWHLYGVDYALACRRLGRGVWVLPQPVRHLSSGKKNPAYFDTIVKVARKHRGEGVINTTMGLWSTNPQMLKLQLRLANSRTPT
jgi:hypothetical protein